MVTSPLIRCRQTLELALPQAAPVVEEGLIECGYGDWEGQPLKKLAKEPLWPVVQQHPSAAVFPEGEAMAAMSARAVAAVRAWDARVTAEHGPEAVWLACSHGDVIKAIVADALGVHLDLFQRIVVDPASVTAIRYTPLRPFLVRLNDTGGDLAALVPPPRKRRRRAARVGATPTRPSAVARVRAGERVVPAGRRRRRGRPRRAAGGVRGRDCGVGGVRDAVGGPDRVVGMTHQVYAFEPPERFVAGTVGPPGERTFFLQARGGGRLVSVALEKVQVSLLAEKLEELLTEAQRRFGVELPEAGRR